MSIRRKTNEIELIPTINIGVEIVNFRNIDELFTASVQPLRQVNFEISDHHINQDEKTFTLNLIIPKDILSEYSVKEDIRQFQKYFLRNNKQYIITVIKVYENILKKKPEISDEIATILQSFAIL